jgi:hypothetical protein
MLPLGLTRLTPIRLVYSLPSGDQARILATPPGMKPDETPTNFPPAVVQWPLMVSCNGPLGAWPVVTEDACEAATPVRLSGPFVGP